MLLGVRGHALSLLLCSVDLSSSGTGRRLMWHGIPVLVVCSLATAIPASPVGKNPAMETGTRGDKLLDDDRRFVKLKTDLRKSERAQVHELAESTRETVRTLLEGLGIKRKSSGLTRLRVYGTARGFEGRKERATDVLSHGASASFVRSNN